jgi:dimethylglycine dehydrogenase
MMTFKRVPVAKVVRRSAGHSTLEHLASVVPGVRKFSGSAKPPANLPSEVDTAIVGGGVTGAAILYNLGLVGAGSSAAIFEKATLTSGATWHAAGLVTYYHGGNNFKFWHQEGVELYKKWQNDEGIPLSFNQPGSMRLIQNEERLKEAHYTLSKSKLYQGLFGGPELNLITPDEVKRLHPLCNTDGLVAALYTEGDGHICPSSVTQTFASKARALGGKIFEHTEVVGLQQMPDDSWEVTVRTVGGDKHVVKAKRVVNCAGLWAERIGQMADVHTPCTVLQHQYVITETVPEVKEYHAKHGHQLPVLRDLEGSYYLRDEGDGLLVGPYEHEDSMELAPESWKGMMPADLTYHLFEGDIERIMYSMEHAFNLVPAIETIGIKTVLNGPTCWPSDGNHLVGPAHEKKNYWHACAESYGIAHGAGLGRYIVHWMQHGEPPYELTEADPVRYGAWATPTWVGEKVKEAYGWNNNTAYFNENRTRARPVLHEDRPQEDIVNVLRSRGAQLGFSHGWETPNWFHSEVADLKNTLASFERPSYMEAVRDECQKVLDHGGLCYWPFAHYRIKGAGAPKFLDRLIANKLPAVGRVGLGHLLTPTGKVYSELTFVRLAEDDFYVTGYSNYQLHDLRWMREHLRTGEDVQLDDVTSSRAVLFINGPKAEETVAKLLDEPCDLARTEFKPFQWRNLKLSGADTIAVRMSFIGEHGLELHVERNQVAQLYEKLQMIDPQLSNWGGTAMNSFRIEKGVPLFGKDITKDHDAWEAGLNRFVKLDKGDFIGREALSKIKEQGGPTRKMVKLEVVGAENLDCVGNEPLRCTETGTVVGFTTSGTWGCLTNKSIALGYVCGPERWADGHRLHVDLLGKRYDAFVRDKAFMDPAAVRDKKAVAQQTLRPSSAVPPPVGRQSVPMYAASK